MCRSGGCYFGFGYDIGKGWLTTLADAGVEYFGEDFVATRGWDGVVGFELDGAADVSHQSDGLGLGDVDGAHCGFV